MKKTYATLLKEKGFSAFLGTQFMSALNDNLLKWVITFMVMAGLLKGGAATDGANLASISLIFILPSLVFTGLAGWMADNFSKRKVLIFTKAFEMLVMVLAWFALRSGQFIPPLFVLFLLATQFTFFGPAKYSVVPELVENEQLSRANGLLEMSTFMAILLGSVLAGPLFESFKGQIDVIAGILLALAVLGSLMSLGIGQVPTPEARKPFKLSLMFSEVWEGTKAMKKDRRLWLTNVGICYFWFQGVLFQLAVVLLGKQVMHLSEGGISHLGMWLALGIGAGSMLAGRLSGDKIELGLVPLGSLLMGFASLALAWSATAHPALVPWALGMVGLSAGLFAVPLNAMLQQKAEDGLKGRILAANNFWSTLAIIVSSLTLGWLSSHFSPDQVILIAGIGCFAVTAYLVTLLPEFLVRFSLWLITHSFYRIRIENGGRVPQKGAALLVCNHMSLADGLLVQACIQRFVRFMVYRPIYEAKPLHWMFKAGSAIPVSAKRDDAMAALEKAKAELLAGHVVCIFAEGSITRHGNLLKFKRGMEKIMEGVDAPIIPVHLDGLWGSLFSFAKGKFMWKWPEQVPYPVTVSFGEPLAPTSTVTQVRRQVQELGSAALETRLDAPSLGRLERRFTRSAKRHFFKLALADSTGRELSHGKALASSLALGAEIKKRVPEPILGILLPSCVPGSLLNLGAAFAGKATVNLNFTAGPEFMRTAVEQCGLKTIFTSRAFLEKAGIAEMPGMVYVEDLFSSGLKARIALNYAACLLTPSGLLERLTSPAGAKSDDLATIIFSSGSTGQPKGVMLTHKNISANLEGLAQVLQVRPSDRLLAVLPFFHSLGYTGTIWFPLCCGFASIHHTSPLDAGVIGKMSAKYRVSIALSTPTFYQAYLRKITPEQFKYLRYAVCGAEKLREPLATAFRERFGVDLLEGYGATEMAPIVAFNVPDVDEGGEHHVGRKLGTVGHPVPGVSAKIVDIDSGLELAPGQSGLLMLKGPNRMAGYWQRPDLTEAVMKDGWYATGDVAVIDTDGFIQLTDRLSRFSKLGGEMVPHLKIEEAAQPWLHADASCLVCAVPDDAKGERLVLLHTDAAKTPAQLSQNLLESSLPRLWLPKQDSIHHVEAIPVLGTGKVDLKKARELALKLAGIS
jgi:acyl-[acyl-carrier-protein]-phospholipid O-acyltransferase/long-chain-fatty-acid--[acyl-carrier-protein] ligase